MARETHRGEVFGLPDLLKLAPRPPFIIAGRTFEGCDFHGPAVFAFITNVNVHRINIDADPDAVLWEVPLTRPRVLGAFGLQDVDLIACSFRNIGFAGSPEFIRDFTAALPRHH